MNKPSDEDLMAYVDGELDSTRATGIREALHADPALAARARLFEATAELLERRYRPVLDRPLPLRLVRAVLRLAAEPARGAGPDPAKAPLRLAAVASFAALAIGLAAGIGATAYWRDRPMPAGEAPQSAQGIEARQLLQRTLENQISGSKVAWHNPDSGQTVSIEPLRTYRIEGGRYCREYREVTSEREGRRDISYGVACRDRGGAWRVRYRLVPGDDPPAALRP